MTKQISTFLPVEILAQTYTDCVFIKGTDKNNRFNAINQELEYHKLTRKQILYVDKLLEQVGSRCFDQGYKLGFEDNDEKDIL